MDNLSEKIEKIIIHTLVKKKDQAIAEEPVVEESPDSDSTKSIRNPNRTKVIDQPEPQSDFKQSDIDSFDGNVYQQTDKEAIEGGIKTGLKSVENAIEHISQSEQSGELDTRVIQKLASDTNLPVESIQHIVAITKQETLKQLHDTIRASLRSKSVSKNMQLQEKKNK